jgi:hypothetical protein
MKSMTPHGITGLERVNREVNPFKRIGYSMHQLLKHLKKGSVACTEYLSISSILRRALLHFNISDI